MALVAPSPLPAVSRGYSRSGRAAAWASALSLAAAVIACFLRAARSDPGRVPRMKREAWAEALRASLPAEERVFVHAARLPWCSICDNLKPPRTHHCRTCSTCVDRMDHHCGFLHNCVGAGNRGKFVALLGSVLAGTGYAWAYAAGELTAIYAYRGGGDFTAASVGRALRHERGARAIDGVVAAMRYAAAARDGRYAALGCLALGVWLGMAVLFGQYVGLAYDGETSLERSARLYRGGPDYRTYPKWPGVRAANDAPRLDPATVLGELRFAGHFSPGGIDEAPPQPPCRPPSRGWAREKDA